MHRTRAQTRRSHPDTSADVHAAPDSAAPACDACAACAAASSSAALSAKPGGASAFENSLVPEVPLQQEVMSMEMDFPASDVTDG